MKLELSIYCYLKKVSQFPPLFADHFTNLVSSTWFLFLYWKQALIKLNQQIELVMGVGGWGGSVGGIYRPTVAKRPFIRETPLTTTTPDHLVYLVLPS